MKLETPCHIVAVIGGAVAGSTVAEALAEGGSRVVVFDQNPRPYGKIEDGLPRWHDKQRKAEYARIDARLDRRGIDFVPQTRLGRELDFLELARDWGWSAIVLANGAWKDRPLDVPGARECAGAGLLYQNPLLHWFNHEGEVGYDGPRYEIPDRTVVIGGGLASLDVIKIVQLELYRRALAERGIDCSMHEMERLGIPKWCALHGIEDPRTLGIEGGLLVYRRRVDDMPLATARPGASQKVLDKLPSVRRAILDKCLAKFLFRFQAQRVPKQLVVEDNRLGAIVLQQTEVGNTGVMPVEGSEHEIRTELVVSSIGSIPEPLPGIEMSGSSYRFADGQTGVYEPLPNVFGAGNVITGQGNIQVSRRHGRFVGERLAECYLGIAGDGDRDISAGPCRAAASARPCVDAVGRRLRSIPPLPADRANALLERVAALQRKAGHEGNYAAWIAKVTPRPAGQRAS